MEVAGQAADALFAQIAFAGEDEAHEALVDSGQAGQCALVQVRVLHERAELLGQRQFRRGEGVVLLLVVGDEQGQGVDVVLLPRVQVAAAEPVVQEGRGLFEFGVVAQGRRGKRWSSSR